MLCAVLAENAAGEGENSFGEHVSVETREIGSVTTEGPPTAATLPAHTLDGEALRVIGWVDPNSALTSAEQTVTIEGAPTGGTFTLTFNHETTAPISVEAPAETVIKALEALPSAPTVGVQGADGGPYTIFFGVENTPLAEKPQPLIEGDGSGLTPSGSVAVATTQQGGEGPETHYRFQYVGQRAFEAQGGFAGTELRETPAVAVGSGTAAQVVAADLPGLTPGEGYRYRILATSSLPGSPVVFGGERELTVPGAPVSEVPVCANAALRVGAGASLPDCRGYEQLTPVFKEGAREPFLYGGATGGGVAIGVDGNHAVLETENVTWGAGPAAGQSPYFFSRQEGAGWQMTAGATQPETGVNKLIPQLLAPDLASWAFSSAFQTSGGKSGSKSANIEYKVGSPGGPYAMVASVPAGKGGAGWVGASEDSSRRFLQLADHTLLGSATGTKQGADLYEYVSGELHQVNVTGSAPGATIGTCGAGIVTGAEPAGSVSSAHAVSSDGSRVLFEAVPTGHSCQEPKHLYIRVGGASTLDIGAYHFIAANAEDTKLLLERRNGEAREVISYDPETASSKLLFALQHDLSFETEFRVSDDLSTVYFLSSEQLTPEALDTSTPDGGTSGLYRYDVAAEKLAFVDSAYLAALHGVSPDGRFVYFTADVVGGVPGAVSHQEHHYLAQAYRFDSVGSVVQCVSCASSFDPEPKLGAIFGERGGNGGMLESRTGHLTPRFASANGDYVFFDTPSALVPADVDGEVSPALGGEENESLVFSPSSDVYEWRAAGVDGCGHVQGCLALITNGRGGFLNLFLGTDDSGRDALIYTSSRLGPRDGDAAGDIYDARIGGGEAPPPPGPVECEGDACSTPPAAPNDSTPSSFTFSGAGNLLAPMLPPTKPKLTRAQLLVRALKACHKSHGHKRALCERQAHKQYGPARPKNKAKKATHTATNPHTTTSQKAGQ